MKQIINIALRTIGLRLVRNKTLVALEQRGASLDAVENPPDLYSDVSLRKEVLRDNIRIYWKAIDHTNRSQVPSLSIVCALCDHESALEKAEVFQSRCIFGGGELTRHRCPACGVIYGPAKMLALSDGELADEYEAHYRVYEEGDSSVHELRAFYALNPVLGGRYLNFGSGKWSETSKLLRSQGWDVWSFEPNVSAASASDPFVLRSWADLTDSRFDGIFSNNVLEHLRNPVATLRTIANSLKPDCLMVHATPCFEYLYEYTRFHLFFFTGRSKYVMADLAGLTVVDYFSDGEYMHIILSA